MKKNYLVILLSLFCLLSEAQNWNVFNKNYRYNYKHDASTIISNVLFQDSISQLGSDTIYYMNRIGMLCVGACPGYTSVLTVSNPAAILNLPQFLQRTIIKYANGLVMLKDPNKLALKPNCALNQTWLFDSISNITATCTAIHQQNLFGILDSVKTILLNQQDTIRISKSFGIISFPELYNQNRSYRLLGIENLNSYDSTALFGTKVPNAWDFYNYQVGDIFCEDYSSLRANQQTSECSKTQYIIISKSISATGYIFGVARYGSYDVKFSTLNNVSCNTTPELSNSILSFPNLNSKNLIENKIYPGMVVQNITISGLYDQFSSNHTYYQNFPSIANFAKGGTGIFYKVMQTGFECGIGIPNNSIYGLSQTGYTLMPYYTLYPILNKSSMMFATTFGLVSSMYKGFEVSASFCKTCFKRNGVTIFGEPYVGLEKNENSINEIVISPNPATKNCQIQLPESLKEKTIKIEIKNVLGEILLRDEFRNQSYYSLNTSTFNAGIYFVGIYLEGNLLEEKKVIVER
jgi:hypothetical protein